MISGWGRYNNCNAEVLKSKNINLIKNKIKQSPKNTFICRGLGRSYGDSSINDKIFDLSNLQKKFQLFEKKKEIKCTSNFAIKELLSIY